jgi:hypothetical protein
MKLQWNVLIGKDSSNPKDLNLLFGEGGEFLELSDEARWPDVLVACGIFKSKSDARKNGWNKDIGEGWTDIRIGKLHTHICVFKMTDVKSFFLHSQLLNPFRNKSPNECPFAKRLWDWMLDNEAFA